MRLRPVHVYVVAAERVYREGLSLALGADDEILLAGDGPNTRAAVAAAAQLTARPLVFVVRFDEQDLARLRALHELDGPDLVVLGVDAAENAVLSCVEAGAAGYVTRDGSLDDVRRAVLDAADGNFTCSPRLAAALARRLADVSAAAPPRRREGDGLSHREREITQLIARGLSNKEIGRCLGIQLATVKNHVHNILEKLEVSSRFDAAVLMSGTDGAFVAGESRVAAIPGRTVARPVLHRV